MKYHVYEHQPGDVGKHISSHASALRCKRAAERHSWTTEYEVYAERHNYRAGRLYEVISVARYERGEQVG